MTRRFVSTLLALAAALLVLSAAGVAPAGGQADPTTTTTAPSGSNGPPVTAPGDPAINELVGCVEGSQDLLVLFLIDESASLKVTDPDDRRVDAARGALDSLIALASSEGQASPNVQVALAAFSNEYRVVQDWTAAGPDTAESLNESLDEFADFNSGIDTDFVNALSAGRESLADQAATVTEDGGAAPCRAVMLFTDGGYDLAVRASEEDQKRLGTTKPYAPGIELTTPENVQKAEARGRRELCDPGKLADRLRGDDITLLTVALSGDVPRRSQLPLAAATTGKADDYTCGTQPASGETARPSGAYLPAEDIDVLVTQFNGVGARLAGGNLLGGSSTVAICGAEPCDEGTRTYELDGSLRRAQILALAPKPGTSLVLEGPEGTSTTIDEAGTGTVGSTPYTARLVAGRGYAVDLNRPADDASWTGEWKVSVVDPKGTQEGERATLEMYVFSDIGAQLGEFPPLERGASTPLEVVLDVPAAIEDESIIKSAEAAIRLVDPVTGKVETVPLKGPPNGPFTGTFETPIDITSNAMRATAQVKVETSSGATLESQSATKELLVRRPAGSIQFAPGTLKMPSLTGEGTSTIEMTLVGGKDAGCVWFGPADIPDAPEGAAPVEMTLAGKPLPTQARCVKVAAGATQTITIEATPADRATGTVRGTLEMFEKVDSAKEATTTQVPFRFDMAGGVDQGKRIVLTLVLFIGGIGLPLLLLVLLNAISARFQSLDAVQGAAIPVRVRNRTIYRAEGSTTRPLSLRSDDFGSLAAAGNDRRFTFGGVEFRARASRNPFGATAAMAAPEGGAEKLKGREGSRVELDPALAGSWIFLLDPDETRRANGGEVVGLLIAFAAEGDLSTQTQRMMPDIADRLPATASSLAGLVRQTKPRTPSKKRPTRAQESEAASGDDAAVDDDAGALDNRAAPSSASTPIDIIPVAPVADDPVDPAPSADDARTEGDSLPVDPSDGEQGAIPLGFGGAAVPSQATPMPMPASTGDEPPDTPPLGFGGAPVTGAPPAMPMPASTGDDDDDPDEGPSGPPLGFGGIRPDA